MHLQINTLCIKPFHLKDLKSIYKQRVDQFNEAANYLDYVNVTCLVAQLNTEKTVSADINQFVCLLISAHSAGFKRFPLNSANPHISRGDVMKGSVNCKTITKVLPKK